MKKRFILPKLSYELYNTFKNQFELLPRITIIYGKGQSDDEGEIIANGIALEWMWIGVFVQVGEKTKNEPNKIIEKSVCELCNGSGMIEPDFGFIHNPCPNCK